MGLRGMNGGGRGLGFGGRGLQLRPDGRAEGLEGVRIAIWSTKAFTARWFAPLDAAEPIIESDLTPVGLDRLSGTDHQPPAASRSRRRCSPSASRSTTTSARSRPGESRQVELTQDRNLSGHLSDLLPAYFSDLAEPRRRPIDRYALMQAILFHDSDTSGTSPLPSRPLHDLDLTGQLVLGRPMLVAEVDRPVTELVLGTGPSAAKASRRPCSASSSR